MRGRIAKKQNGGETVKSSVDRRFVFKVRIWRVKNDRNIAFQGINNDKNEKRVP